MILAWVRFLAAAALILAGVAVMVIAVVGIFRFSFVINRMHITATCDTLGMLMVLLGLILLCGFSATSLKLALILIFVWLASPVSSHLISRLEKEHNPRIEEECEVVVIHDHT